MGCQSLSKVIKEGKKIIIKKDEKQLAKEAREQRIKERKIKQDKATIEDIFQYLNDTNTRLEEIYDLIVRRK